MYENRKKNSNCQKYNIVGGAVVARGKFERGSISKFLQNYIIYNCTKFHAFIQK